MYRIDSHSTFVANPNMNIKKTHRPVRIGICCQDVAQLSMNKIVWRTKCPVQRIRGYMKNAE